MAKYFRNRSADEVKALIESLGYKPISSNGDDVIYGLSGFQYTVKLPMRNEDMPIGTMQYITRMLGNNGTTKKNMLKWWKENGYGE